jgi:hypothetical protein
MTRWKTVALSGAMMMAAWVPTVGAQTPPAAPDPQVQQDRAELSRDRKELRGDQRKLSRDKREVREDRREVRRHQDVAGTRAPTSSGRAPSSRTAKTAPQFRPVDASARHCRNRDRQEREKTARFSSHAP